jgi:hypothetical protein
MKDFKFVASLIDNPNEFHQPLSPAIFHIMKSRICPQTVAEIEVASRKRLIFFKYNQ